MQGWIGSSQATKMMIRELDRSKGFFLYVTRLGWVGMRGDV